MKQDQAIKKLPLMNKFEAMVLIRINKEKQLAYAYMIQDAMLSKEISSSSEGRRQNFMSEYPSLKIDNDNPCHGTLLRQELQELSQRKVLSVITNFEDQSDHNHYILQETVYYLIQEVMLSNERSSSSEGIRQRFISEYPWQKSDEDNRHSTLLSQELQKLSQSKVLSVLTNVDDQTDHHLYILQGSLCHLYILQETIIQEAMLSKERLSSSEGRSQRFISEHILSKYPSLKNAKDDLRHTTLISQELTQRKVISLIINVEDQSANHYILQETLSYENTDAANYPLLKISLLYLLLLRAANYPLVIAQQLQEGRHEEVNNNDIGIMEKKTRKLKYKSAQEIDRRMDDGVEGTGTNANANVEAGTFDDGQVARIEKNSLRRTGPNTVDEPKDDAGEEAVGEEEHQEEEVRVGEEGQEEEYQEEEVGGEDQRDEEEGDQDEDEEENGDEDMNEEEEDEDEDEDDEEEVLLGEEGEAIVETVLEKLDAMVATEAKAVVAELADEMELEELVAELADEMEVELEESENEIIESIEEEMVDEVKNRIEGMLVDETEKIIATQEAAAEAAALIAKAEAEKRIAIQEAADKAAAKRRIAIQEAADKSAALIAKAEADREDEETSKAELAKVEALHAEAEAMKIAAEQAVALFTEAQASGSPMVLTAEKFFGAIELAADAAAKAAAKAAKHPK